MVTDIKETKRKDLLQVDPRNIVVKEGFNVRTDMGNLEELLESILEVGLQNPIKCSKVRGTNQYELVEGHRRFAAIQLGIERGYDFQFIDVLPFTGNEEDKILTMIVTGIGQKKLTELEQAEAFRRLEHLGYTQEKISKKVSKSVGHVSNMLQISSFPERYKKVIESGEISGTTVLHIVRAEKDEVKQYEIIQEAIKDANVGHLATKPKTATTKNVKALKKESIETRMKLISDALIKDNVSTVYGLAFLKVNEILTSDMSVEEIVASLKSE